MRREPAVINDEEFIVVVGGALDNAAQTVQQKIATARRALHHPAVGRDQYGDKRVCHDPIARTPEPIAWLILDARRDGQLRDVILERSPRGAQSPWLRCRITGR